jgi:hypothetical protein
LPAADAADVRKLIRALERDGVSDAEDVVRRDRQAGRPAIATLLLKRALDAAIQELPAADRDAARKAVDAIDGVIADGERNRDPLPGWALMEMGVGREPTGRRLRLSD